MQLLSISLLLFFKIGALDSLVVPDSEISKDNVLDSLTVYFAAPAVKTLDSLVVSDFKSRGVSADEARLVTNTIRTELGKHFSIVSLEDLEILTKRDFNEAIEVCKTHNIPILVSGEVKKVADKYRIQVIYLDLAKDKGDTIVAITTSPLATTSLIANSFIKLTLGEEEKDFGSIRFETHPKRADILLDGELIGITPEKIDLVPFGQHSVLFSKKGYATAVKPIVVYPGRSLNISLPLVPTTGTLIAPDDKVPVYWIDEVVVRGKKIREELFAVPRGVEVITSKDIEYSGAKDVPELLSRVAGVSVRDKTGSGVTTSLSIRGMDPSKYTVVTLDGVVINRIDGNVNWNSIPMEMVKRIEVVKGTASSSYGGGAVGGIINIITKEREKNKISLSSANARDGGWAVTLSAFENWALWVNTNGRKGRGWRKFDEEKDEEYDIRSFYGKFTFPIDRDNTVAFSLDAIGKKNLFPGGLTENELKDKGPTYFGQDREDKSWENVRLTSHYEMKTSDSKFLFKFYTMPQGYEATGIKKWSFNGIEIGTSTEYECKNFTFLMDGSFSNLSREVYYPASTRESYDNSQSTTVKTLLEWKERLSNIIILTPGIKFEWIKYRLKDYLSTPAEIENIYTYAISPKFGLMWSSVPLDIFTSMERSIRLPKPYEKVKNIKLKPEVITTFEVGTRVRYYRFIGSLSLFYMNFQDQILLEGAEFMNFPEDAFHRGIEGGLNYRINKNLSLFSTHTLLEAMLEERDKWVPNVPRAEHTFGIRLTYMPIYSLTTSYSWHDKSYIDIENKFPQTDAYGTLDFTLKVKPHSSCSFTFGVTNFTGEEGKKIFGYEAPAELGKKEGLYYPISPRGFRVAGSFEF